MWGAATGGSAAVLMVGITYAGGAFAMAAVT
jgi:hypothetical protein